MSVAIKTFDPVSNSFTTVLPDVIAANKYRLQEVPENYSQVSVMRPSVLGNPFRVGDKPGEYPRGEAVIAHQKWFREQMRDKDSGVYKEVLQLAERVAKGEKLALVCCCKPKACHATILSEAIMGYAQRLRENK